MNASHNTVYIETTIPSFYYTLRTDPESVARMHWTRRWWEVYVSEARLVTSVAVIEELQGGKGGKIDNRVALLDQVIILPITNEVIDSKHSSNPSFRVGMRPGGSERRDRLEEGVPAKIRLAGGL